MTDSRRIVLASEFWFGATPEGIAHGLRKLGWDVCAVDTNHHFLQSRFLSLRLLSRAAHRASIASYNAAVLEAVDTLRPRAFLTVKGIYLTPDTLRQIRGRGVMTINYYPDYHFDYAGLDQETFKHYDLFYTTKSFQLLTLRQILVENRVEFLQHGFSDLVHVSRLPAVAEGDYLADITYAGNFSPYKEKWLAAILRRLPDVCLRIIGSRWHLAEDEAVRASALGHALLGDCYARAIQTSRINVALHGGPGGRQGWKDLVSTRTFEIPACKGFMLHIDNDEVRALYEPGKEIDVFATEEQLCEKIVHYLARPQIRQEMIERAYARCVPAYSYAARAEVIAYAIEGRQ